MSAGDWARGMYANADAILHYQQVLAALEHRDAPAEAAQIETERLAPGRWGCAPVCRPAPRPRARRAAPELADATIVEAASRAAGDAPAQARILRKIGGLHWDAGARPRALQCFEAGLALLGEA